MKTTFKCKLCGKKFNHKNNLRNHQIVHTGEKPYSCTKCDKTFARSQELKLHLNYHLGIKPYKCNLCPKTFSQPTHLKAHLRTHTGEKPFKCLLCPKRFTQSSHLRTHQSHHTGEKPYKCDECGDTFRLASTLKCHVRRHTGEKPYKCHICGMTFSQTTPLYHHLQKHTGQLPFKCRYCGRGFGMRKTCHDHERTVCISGGRRRWVCVFCKDRCYTEVELNRHILQHIRERPYLCRFCDLCFISAKARKYHMRVHVDLTGSKPSEKQKPFQCKLCHHSFSEEERYQRHLNQNHLETLLKKETVAEGHPVTEENKKGKFDCQHCGASFNTRGEIRDHNINIHLVRKKMTGPRFYLVNKVKRKRRAPTSDLLVPQTPDPPPSLVVEKKRKSGQCKLCQHSFSDEVSLALHVRLVHEGLTPQRCFFCCKSFPSTVNLAKHVKEAHYEEVNSSEGKMEEVKRMETEDREEKEGNASLVRMEEELAKVLPTEETPKGGMVEGNDFDLDVKPDAVAIVVWEMVEELKKHVVLLEAEWGKEQEKREEEQKIYWKPEKGDQDEEEEELNEKSLPYQHDHIYPSTTCLPNRCTAGYSLVAL